MPKATSTNNSYTFLLIMKLIAITGWLVIPFKYCMAVCQEHTVQLCSNWCDFACRHKAKGRHNMPAKIRSITFV